MSYWKYNPVTRFLEENATKSIGTRHLTATMSVYERLDTLG